MKLSIILPIHNQEDHIPILVKEYRHVLKALPHKMEIIFVVNGSTDASYKKLAAQTSSDAHIHIYDIKEGGWGRAVKFGLKKGRGEFFCYTNSARTDVQDMITMVHHVLQNPRVVIKAHRQKRDSFFRAAGSLLYSLEGTLLHGVSNFDINGTPKLFARKIYNQLHIDSNGDLFDLEFLIQCKKNGVSVVDFPVAARKRLGGKSTTNVRSAVRLYIGAVGLKIKNL